MITSIIVAISENNVIGRNNDLPWHLPDDMKFFKETTWGHHVLMGRKNYLSIPEKFRPLKNRTNIILTRNKSFEAPGCVLAHDLKSAIELAKKAHETELFVSGGGMIFNQVMEQDLADRLYVTEIHQQIDGDVFFPKINPSVWKKKNEQFHGKDERHPFSFSFCIYEK